MSLFNLVFTLFRAHTLPSKGRLHVKNAQQVITAMIQLRNPRKTKNAPQVTSVQQAPRGLNSIPVHKVRWLGQRAQQRQGKQKLALKPTQKAIETT